MIIGEPPAPSGAFGVDAIAMTMRFGDFTALDNVELKVRPGSFHALAIFAVITLYGLFVAGTMTLVLVWYRRNRRVHRKEIEAQLEIARSERH